MHSSGKILKEDQEDHRESLPRGFYGEFIEPGASWNLGAVNIITSGEVAGWEEKLDAIKKELERAPEEITK